MFFKIRRISIIAMGVLTIFFSGESHAGISDQRELARGTSTFTLSLYRQILAEKKGNVLFSPYSISMALALANAGAKGKTAEEIERTLGFTLPADTLYPALRELSQHITEAGNKYGQTLSVANAAWLKKDFKVQPDYSRLLKDYFNNDSRQLDFCQGARASKIINDWIAKETQDHIRDLVPADALNCDARLVLTNAVYFMGSWASPFEEGLTQQGLFGQGGAKKDEVPLMRRKGTYAYAELEGWQALELPYKGKRLSMLVLLPSSGIALEEIEKKLESRVLENISEVLTDHEVDVTFPKFEIRTDYRLNEYLKRAGIREGFDRRAADFSGITTGDKLFINDVLHKAWVKADEKGTVAAAATSGRFGALGGGGPVIFKADHPFLFLIKDKDTGLVLFFGRVYSPKSTN